MTNLLRETLEVIGSRDTKDIIFIGSRYTGESCTWEDFKALADIEYNSGYGGVEISLNLIIVFADGSIMKRREYDGSEWWDLIEPFVLPAILTPMTDVKARGYF